LPLEDKIILGLIIGIIAYICLYLGKGIQKYAIEGFRNDKSQKGKNKRIWIFGFALTTSYMFIQWIALLYAPLNIIIPLGGIGLVVLILFSYFVLKEDISHIQIIGIALIITGTLLATIFNDSSGELKVSDFNLNLYLLISLSLIAIEVRLLQLL